MNVWPVHVSEELCKDVQWDVDNRQEFIAMSAYFQLGAGRRITSLFFLNRMGKEMRPVSQVIRSVPVSLL